MQPSTEGAAPQPLFVQYMTFKADPAWRRLPLSARDDGRESFAQAIEEYAPAITTWAYSTLGMKTGCELLLWRRGADPIAMQEMTSRLLQTGMGSYFEIVHNLYGFTRPSSYTKRPTSQEQAIDLDTRQTFLTVYPFSKTIEWYLMSKEARQGMMNEHIRIGHEYVVAYEMEDLPRFSALVTALRDTEARRYTLRDTPIITGIHRPLREALTLIG
jgi:chlorite dismutase